METVDLVRRIAARADRGGVLSELAAWIAATFGHEPRDLAGYGDICWLDRGRIRARGGPALLAEFEARMIEEGASDDLADLAG